MPINTFNIGDKVKIKGINAQWSWQKGVIYKIENTVIIVKLDSGKNLNFNANELESII